MKTAAALLAVGSVLSASLVINGVSLNGYYGTDARAALNVNDPIVRDVTLPDESTKADSGAPDLADMVAQVGV